MATLHMLIGIPGSGKSTYSRNVLKVKYPNAIYVASDEVRNNNPGMKEDLIWPEIYRLTNKALKEGFDCILDCTNVTPEVRAKQIEKIKSLGDVSFDMIAYFFPTDPQKCYDRVVIRNQNPNERWLPVDIIPGYGKQIIPPTLEEGFKEIVIVDNNNEGFANIKTKEIQ